MHQYLRISIGITLIIIGIIGLFLPVLQGVLLILGCCHSGLRNTVKWAEEVTGDEVKFIVGGTHLIAYSPEKIREIVSKLDFEFIAPCHCTGLKAEFILMEMLGDRFRMVGSGSVIEV